MLIFLKMDFAGCTEIFCIGLPVVSFQKLLIAVNTVISGFHTCT